ncbi:Dynein light chain 2, cytoplasmic [Mizuhopecten yessoensis]|uniref:Dynein light chain n=1 Tax=Mizuhopecten yessoensis TaxID=6573 RepID=A0A210PTF5_MIZYE|nr:Dynein light chain 2, cytoplasmic [Mizuhopecten yessoensis]
MYKNIPWIFEVFFLQSVGKRYSSFPFCFEFVSILNIQMLCFKFSEIMTDRKAVIKNADMAEDMQQDCVDCATQALEKYNIEKDIAAYIKKEFDKKYNPTWHCIVGRNFGSYVTHETKHFIYFYLGQVAILLFKSG